MEKLITGTFLELSSVSAKTFLSTLARSERALLWELLIHEGNAISIDQDLFHFLRAPEPKELLERIRKADPQLERFLRAIESNNGKRAIDLLLQIGVASGEDFRKKAQAYLLFTDRTERIARPAPDLKAVLRALFSRSETLLEIFPENPEPTLSVWEEAEDIACAIHMKKDASFSSKPIADSKDAECGRAFREAVALSGMGLWSTDLQRIVSGWKIQDTSEDHSPIYIDGRLLKSPIRINGKEKRSAMKILQGLSAGKWYKASSVLKLMEEDSGLSEANKNAIDDLIRPLDISHEEKSKLRAEASRIIHKAVFQSILYTSAYMGIIELYEKEKDSPNGYDSLEAIRLTPLGPYLLGLSRTRPPQLPDRYPVVADSRMLILSYSGYRPGTISFLTSIGTRFGSCRYIVTKDSFSRGGYRIDEKIKTLTKMLQDPMPDNWQAFLKEMKEGKTNAIELVAKGRIFRIENEKDAAIIMGDEKIRTLIKPIGKGLIFLPDDKLRAFSSRIEKLGFHLDSFNLY